MIIQNCVLFDFKKTYFYCQLSIIYIFLHRFIFIFILQYLVISLIFFIIFHLLWTDLQIWIKKQSE